MNVTRTILLGLVPFAALIFFNVKIYERIKITRRRYSRNNNNTSQVNPVFSTYSHFSNNRGGWNKRGGEAKIAKSLNVEAGIKVEVGKYL